MKVSPNCELEHNIVYLCRTLQTIYHPDYNDDNADSEAMIAKLQQHLPPDEFPSLKGWIEELLLLSANRLSPPPDSNPEPNNHIPAAPPPLPLNFNPPRNDEDTNSPDPWLMSKGFPALCAACPQTFVGQRRRVNYCVEFCEEFERKKEMGARNPPTKLVGLFYRVLPILQCVRECHGNDVVSLTFDFPKQVQVETIV